jgi:hypothetical protein
MFSILKKHKKDDTLEQLVGEFWRVNNEVEKMHKAYGNTREEYIDCAVYDLNAKIAYRDVLLREIRAHKADWQKSINLRNIDVDVAS